jgi:hypothetical protein
MAIVRRTLFVWEPASRVGDTASQWLIDDAPRGGWRPPARAESALAKSVLDQGLILAR